MDRRQKAYRQRKKEGLCTVCRKPPRRAVKGQTRCFIHRAANAAKNGGHRVQLAERRVLFHSQNRRCSICNRPIKLFSSIDHNHRSGQVRGMLCDRCNYGIGYFKDSGSLLRRAASYVENGHTPRKLFP